MLLHGIVLTSLACWPLVSAQGSQSQADPYAPVIGGCPSNLTIRSASQVCIAGGDLHFGLTEYPGTVLIRTSMAQQKAGECADCDAELSASGEYHWPERDRIPQRDQYHECSYRCACCIWRRCTVRARRAWCLASVRCSLFTGSRCRNWRSSAKLDIPQWAFRWRILDDGQLVSCLLQAWS